jgi:hypothetical protein
MNKKMYKSERKSSGGWIPYDKNTDTSDLTTVDKCELLNKFRGSYVPLGSAAWATAQKGVTPVSTNTTWDQRKRY